MDCYGTATYSFEDDKLRFYPDAKLPEEIYQQVHMAGFIWAPVQKLFVQVWSPEREDLLLALAGDVEDEATSAEDRAWNRAERFAQYSKNAEARGEHEESRAEEMTDGIRQLIGNLFTLIETDPDQRKRDIDGLSESILTSDELTEIASTPLFCSALVQVYKYHGAHLPERRVDVLDEIVELLLGYWKAQQSIADAESLAAQDGTGKTRRLEEAINVKRQRLSYLAYQMQENHQVEIEAAAASEWIARHMRERERVRDEETALAWAEEFLINSHEHSGLLAEHEPGKYAFLHKAFMEYLAATWFVNRNEVIPTTLTHLDDDWWEPVLLLAGAHPKLSESFQSDLIRELLAMAEKAGPGGNSLAPLVMAGKLATDMSEHLSGPERELVEETLAQAIKTKEEYEAFLGGVVSEDDILLASSGTRYKAPEPKRWEELEKTSVEAGGDVPGFYPTPPNIVMRMIEKAMIEPALFVLEPSAGKGDIADALRARGCAVTCVELDVRLAEFLRKKRHKVFQQDFLVFNEGGSFYNRVIMNPPFGNLQELDHVYHAYDLLLPGGILVAILPESPFFQENKKAAAFRQWLEERDADIEELLAGAFHDSGTEVKTRIVTVKKHA